MCVRNFAKCKATKGSIRLGAVFDVGIDPSSEIGIFVVAPKATANSCESNPL